MSRLYKNANDDVVSASAPEPGTSTAAFAPGDKVTYVPGVAHGDPRHEACERGIVSSCNELYVFVKYQNADGSLKLHAQATAPDDLRKGWDWP